MAPVLVLLPSPLLGPRVWQSVAGLLRAAGRETVVAAVGEVSTAGEVVLVPHSNAGLYVPGLTEGRRVAGFVFVDAGLPPAGPGRVPLAPAAFREFLAGKADAGGLLPPWTQWWGDGVDELFPDAATRAEVEAEQTRLPLAYFERTLPVPAGWDGRPGAYLAFGDTYADERAAAEARGWPTRTLDGGHLHMLIDPPAVATAIAALTDQVLAAAATSPTDR